MPTPFTHFRTGLLLGLLLTLALACGSGEKNEPSASAPAPGASAPIRISQGSDVLSMDPYAHNESPTFAVHRNIFDPLVDLDADLKIQPGLAERWETTGPTVWVFHLRPNVRFHGGQPFTAADAVFSLRRALDDPKSRVKPELQTIREIEAIDDLTLRIRTATPDAILPLRLTSILILDRESTEAGLSAEGEAWLATNANGTGPYRLEYYRKDERCLLAANPDCWAGKAAIERIEFLPDGNDATRMAALQRGEYDILVNVPPRNIERARQNPAYRIVERESLRLIYLGLDCGREQSPGILDPGPNPLRDPRVRRAIALGIDNGLIVKSIMAGHARPADQLLPEGIVGYDPAIVLKRPDYEQARKLLAEAGYPAGFRLRLDGPNDRYVNDDQILQAVAQELARIGITVQVNAQPKARFFSDERAGQCSFFLIGWSNTGGDGVGTFEHLLHTPRPELNLGNANTSTNYSNARLDEIIGLASGEFDPARREALLREANRIAIDELPHIPLHFQVDTYAVAAGLDWSPRRDTQVRGMDLRRATR